MPGYVIHIAIAQEYLKKHKKKFSKKFIEGVISPDLTSEKSKTHYGKSPAYTNLSNFLAKNKLNSDFNQGFFLHLITDYLFYNQYLEKIEKPQIYYDYDFTNKILIEKYDVVLPKNIKNQVFFKNGEPKILTLELAFKVINEISDLNLEEVYREVIHKNVKWNQYKNLI